MQVLVDAVEHRAGGNHKVLAKKIADSPLGMCDHHLHPPSCVSPSPLSFLLNINFSYMYMYSLCVFSHELPSLSLYMSDLSTCMYSL